MRSTRAGAAFSPLRSTAREPLLQRGETLHCALHDDASLTWKPTQPSSSSGEAPQKGGFLHLYAALT